MLGPQVRANSGSCQFYSRWPSSPSSTTRFTVFGHVVEGLDAMDALSVGDAIESIRIEGADEEALAQAVSHETPAPEVREGGA